MVLHHKWNAWKGAAMSHFSLSGEKPEVGVGIAVWVTTIDG